MAILAFGPVGPITLHKVLTYALVAGAMAGVGALQVVRSKAALNENFRERPWQFFRAAIFVDRSSNSQAQSSRNTKGR